MIQPTHPDLDALDKLIDAADGWKWETVQGDQFGHLSEGEFYDIGTVDANQYAVGDESHNEAVLNFITAFNPQTCRALIDRLRKAEAAREGWKLVPERLPQGMRDVIINFSEAVTAGRSIFFDDFYEELLAAAPASTPTDSADSEGAKG